MEEAGVPQLTIRETGRTPEENALIKASAYQQATGMTTLGDDSGMEIDALNGKPGVSVRRWGGLFSDEIEDEAWLKFFLEQVKEVPKERRTGRYITAWAIVRQDGASFVKRVETPFRYATHQLRPIPPGWPMDAVTESMEEDDEVFYRKIVAWIKEEKILPVVTKRG